MTDPETTFFGTGSATYTYDNIAPDAFTVTGSNGDSPTRAVAWSWTAPESGLTATCQLRQLAAPTVWPTPTACTSPYTTTVPADGAWQLAVTLTDAAKNSTDSLSPEVRVDTGVPLKPTVSTRSNPSNNLAPTWTITGEATGTTFTCSWATSDGGSPLPATGPCSTGYAPALPAKDGTYTLSVTQKDAAGNTSPSTDVAYRLDQTAPTVSFTAPTPARGTSTTVTWTFTPSEALSSSQCRLVKRTGGVDTAQTGWTPCDRSYTADLTGLGDGTFALQVKVVDLAGNPNDSSSSTGELVDPYPYVLDTTAPGVPTVVGSRGYSQSTAVSWTITGSSSDTAKLYCRLVKDDDTTTATWTDCTTAPATTTPPADATGAFSTTLTTDGQYRLDVVAADDLDNRTTPVVSSEPYFLDRQVPGAMTFSPIPVTGNATTQTWTWTQTETTGITTDCRLYSVTGTTRTLVNTSLKCTSPRTEQLAKSTPGTTYLLEVTQTDQALNATVTDGPTYLLDTVAPDAPAVDGPSAESNVQAVHYTITPKEAGTTSTCTLSSRDLTATNWVVVSTSTTCSTTGWDVTLPKVDAYYRVAVTSTDAAKNVSIEGLSPEYHLDVTGPAAPVFTTSPSGRANVADVSWTWTFENLATSVCTVTYAGTVVVNEPCTSGSYGTKLTAGDGVYTLTVTLKDRYGNVGGSATSVDYFLDTTPPAGIPTVSSNLPTTGNVTSGSYSIMGPNEAFTAECQLRRDGAVVSPWASCTFPKAVAFSGDGSYVLDVRLTDPYKNTGAEGHSAAYLLDTKLPTLPVVTVPTSPSSNAAPVFGVVIDADTSGTCELRRGSTVVAPASPCSTSYTAALSTDGDYVLTVVSKDAAGNTATGSSTAYTFDTTPPTAPVVTGPAGPSQNRNPVFSWTGELGATAECAAAKDGATAGGWVACSSPYAPTLPADGTWMLSVRLSDAARNVGPAGTSGGYVLDTTAPATPVVTPPQTPGRNLSPSWSAVTEAGSTTECRFTGQLDFTPCTLPLTTPVTVDGEYVLSVRSTDVAGNVSAVGTGTYVLDTTAPPAPVVTQPSGPGRSRTPSIAFTTETGSTGSCRLTRGSTVIAETGPCTSPAGLDLTGLPDGAYTLTVRAVDAAGNTGPAATGTYVLDTTAPAAPVLTLVPGSPSSDRAPVYAFSTEAGAIPTCRLTTPAGAVKELTCTSPLTLDLSGSTDGAYDLAITVKDAAGNTSAAATSTFTLDSNAPVAPRLTGPVTPGSTRTPAWKVASAAPAECRLVRGLTVVKDWAACSGTYTADLYGQPDGVYALEARVVGTTAASSSRYRLDTAGPAAATITAPPSPSTVLRPVWAIASAEPNVTAECQVTVFGEVLQDWAPCAVSAAGSLFTAPELTRGDGTYTLHVRLTDAAGNVGGTIATSDYVLDTSAPAAVGIIGPASPGRLSTPTWTITSGTGVKLECQLTRGSTVVKPWAPCTDTFSADLSGLGDGTYTLTVHALSAAGTPGPDTTSLYEYDTTAAEKPTALTVDPVGPSQNRAPRWTFVLPPGSKALCKVTLGEKVISDGPCDSPYIMDLSNAADGSYTMSVRAVDQAGNQSAPVTKGYVLRTVPPTAPVFTMAPGSPSSTVDPRWAFTTGRATAQCRILLNGQLTEDWGTCASPYTLFLTGRPDGRYTLQVRSVDLALNTSKVVESSYDFDRTAAALAMFVETPVSPGVDLSPTWLVAAPIVATTPALLRAGALTVGGAATECRWGVNGNGGTWQPCAGSYTGSTTGDGRYQLELRTAADGTTAAGPASTSWYQLDTLRPNPPVLVPGQDPVGNEAEVSWSWADDPDLLAECRLLKGDNPTAPYTVCDSPFTASLGRFGQGSFTAQVRLTDLAGNVSDPGSSTYRYDTTPPPAPFFTSKPPLRGTSGSVRWTFAVIDDATALCRLTHDGVVTESPCNGEFRLDRLSQPGTWTLSVQYVDTAGNASRPTLGSYTLTTPVLVRDRIDSPTGGGTVGGSDPFTPRPPVDRGGFGSPDVPPPPAPGRTPLSLPEADHPKLDAIARAAEPIKRAVESIGKALGLPRIPPGLAEGTRVPDAIKNVLNSTITRPQLPLALLFIVVLFLLVQNRIDRRDPKLAAAPVSAEPELAFGPRVRSLTTGGGATA
ncbi:MAG: hypothetical protein ABR614_14235 [Mycobacteriales bacterium]